MSQHVISTRTNWLIFWILMVLLVATVGAAQFDLGRANLFVALVIAAIKAGLIILYFMHVRFASRLTWVFSTAAFFWLFLMLALTFNDYAGRGWLMIDGK